MRRVKEGVFATILDSQEIRARKRLFMTATPRIASEASKSRADSMGLELVSMDDHKVFGPVFHELKFSDAIRLKLLTDYRVEIIGVDDPLYRQYAEQGVFVTLDGKTVTDARKLTSYIAVAKVINSHLHEVSSCYERALLRTPGLTGKIVLEWQITISGTVGYAKTKSSSMQSPAVESCILMSLKTWKFPPAKGAGVVITYPFMFNSVGY